MNSPINVYYYLTISGSVEQYKTNRPEQLMVSYLTAIGERKMEPSDIDLKDDIIAFLFPSGRVWYLNGNHFVPETPARFNHYMLLYKKQQRITDSKKEG